MSETGWGTFYVLLRCWIIGKAIKTSDFYKDAHFPVAIKSKKCILHTV